MAYGTQTFGGGEDPGWFGLGHLFSGKGPDPGLFGLGNLFNPAPSFTQANPYTQDWMSGTGNEQNMLKQMIFGGGGQGGGLLASYMNPMSAGGFMSQFLSAAPALQGLTRSASDAETARATDLGNQGIQDAAAQFAGLGSLYSGANLFAGNKAMQQSMGDLSGKIASENFNLLNNLYGNSINQFAGAQQAGLADLFGLYGLNSNNLAGASSPMIMANPTLWDQLSKLLGGAGSAAGGFAAAAKAFE